MRDKRKLKTQIKQNTTKPEWNEEFQLLIHEPEHQHLTLHMFDHDVLSVDDEIGRGSFPIRNLRNGEEEELDIEIKEQKGQKVDQMMVSVLCCAVLCCAVPCCAVLCCAVPCRAVPCRAVLHFEGEVMLLADHEAC